jgi:hypothetical protein
MEQATYAACPYCNAELPVLGTPPATSQAACPRCGEPISADRFPVANATPPAQNRSNATTSGFPPPSTVHTADESPSEIRQRKRATLFAVLAVMCGMAAMALIFALFTRDIRRKRDPKPRLPTDTEAAERPAELRALCFLPNGTNVAVGIDLVALSKEPVGAELLREPRSGLNDRLLSVLDLADLKLADVDHVVAGSDLKGLTFHITTVVVTRAPYDPERPKENAQRKGHKVTVGDYHGSRLYRFPDLPQLPKLWCAKPRILVHTTLPTDEIPTDAAATSLTQLRKQATVARLTPAARSALSDRLSKQSRMWAVGDLETAKGLVDSLQLFAGPLKEEARMLTLVRAFAIGITIPEPGTLTLTGDFYTGAPDATQELRNYLEEVKVPGAKSHKVEAPPADIEAAEAQWVTWQVRADAAVMRDLLGKLSLGQEKKPAANR